MKNKIVIGIMVLGCVQAIHAGKVLDMLRAKKIELQKHKQQIIDNRHQLVQVHGQLMKDLVGKINDTINGELAKFSKTIDMSKKSIKDVPSIGLQFAGIGDIGDALDAIKNVLETTKTILVSVRDQFQPIINDLAPKADPKGIYKGLDEAVSTMNNADDEIAKFEKFVEALNL